MEQILSTLPAEIQVHIKKITQSSGLPDEDASYEQIAQGWIDKQQAFDEKIAEQGMTLVDNLSVDDPKGAVVLTYSGSLILIGPLQDEKRKAAYYSIGVRKNVPESVSQDDSVLECDIEINNPVKFSVGPIKSTSAIYKIAVCIEELDAEAQETIISDVTIIMTKEFADINKALVPV